MLSTAIDLLRSTKNVALVLACTGSGTYVVLLIAVLVNPKSARGKAAKELLLLHPLSKRATRSRRERDRD